MESFLRHMTNQSFAKMLQNEIDDIPEEHPEETIVEAKNTSFDAIIDSVLKPEEKKVYGRYSLQNKSFKLNIDRRDQATFVKLFKEAPDKTVGNGEISLYWLFNGSGRKRAFETRGGNEPDLKIDKKSVEVKAYPYHDPISLGRFQDRRLFRSLINTLFGISNLAQAFEGGEGRGQQSFKGELSFKYKDLLDSAQKYLDLKEVLSSNKKILGKFPVFKQMDRTITQFDSSMKQLGLKARNPSANDIAIALMKHLIEVSVGDKPGDKGYIANLKDKDPLDIYFHYIDFANMTDDEKILSQKGTFSVNGGVFKANFSRLFG